MTTPAAQLATPGATNRLGVALVGFGRWGANHARTISSSPATRLVGVADASADRRAEAVARYGVPVHADIDSMLQDVQVEALVIASPMPTHVPITRRAIASGRHVLIEKPAATATAQVDELISLAETHDVRLSVGHTFLYAQPIRNIDRWLRRSAPSEPWLIRSERLGGSRRPDCDVLWNLAPHDVSILLHLMRQPAVEVSARGHSFPGGRDWDTMTVDIRFSSGARGEIYVGWRHSGAKRSLRVLGKDWGLSYRQARGGDYLKSSLHVEGPGAGETRADDLYRDCERGSPDTITGYREPLLVELEEFAAACRTGIPTVTGPAHLRAVTAILEACARSAAEGGRLVEPDC